MTKMIGKVFAAGLLLLGLGLSSVASQCDAQTKAKGYYSKEGRLNVWTTESVLRQKIGSPEFVTMRFGKHEGFDRVVFELKGEWGGYYVTYEEPFLSDGGNENPNVRGKSFAKISLYPVYSTDENVEASDRIAMRQDKLGMPVIRGIKQLEWFEGELSYVVGLKRRTPYRVQVFSNPTRLVVDFKR